MKVKERCQRLSAALAKGSRSRDSYTEYFNAAVLVPLVWENNQFSILFEVRSADLAWQPGEICFPGGRIDAADKSPADAAVRETHEELGVKIEEIQVLGSLHEVVSPIGVRLYPFIAYLSCTEEIRPNLGEVAEVFSVPLDFLLQHEPIIGHMERCTRPLKDFPFDLLPGYSEQWKSRKNYKVLFYKYKEYVIWGLTAQVLHNFLEVYKKNLANA